MNTNESIHTLIIGAGLTGLSTAHFLQKAGSNFLVLDRNSHPGGVIQTHTENGFVYETGPNTGVIGSSEIVELFEDLQGLCELETANEHAQKRYILKNGQWEPLPSGLMAGIKTPLFSLKDKFRLLGEPFRSKGKNPHESLSGLVKRRMGQSFLDYAIDPFIIGVYAGDPDILIPKYALPKLYNLEQDYGSFIGGAIKKQFQKKSEADKKITRKVFSAKGGLSNLAHALYEKAGKENFRFNIANPTVQPNGKQYKVSWQHEGETHTILASNVVFTGSSFELPEVYPFLPKNDLDKITNLLYAKIIEITLGFNRWEGIDLDGFGGLIPSKEKRDVLGVLFMSTLFEDRAPKDGALLTVFMGGIRNEKITELSDEQVREVVKREIADLMQLPGFQANLFKITRYRQAIPQYEVSSGVRFETIEKIEKQYPGLLLGGNMRDGIGMADRAKQGKMLAELIINR
ncbi:MAG: protoporphyrinogen oxidase [Bacteroidetes bacterium]|nr:MAG: protoporphyrinogen oxidase [Bacteroidota bacterium]